MPRLIVLESLPDSFNKFKLNYNMNKLDLSLAELTSSLQVAAGIIKLSIVRMWQRDLLPSPTRKANNGGKEKKKQDLENLLVNQGPSGGVGKGKKRVGSKPKGFASGQIIFSFSYQHLQNELD